MNFKTAYLYNENTKEYKREIMCQQSPLQPGVYLLAANSTFIQPPQQEIDKAIIWDSELNQWKYVDDNRKKTIYDITDGRKKKIQSNNLFDPIPEGYTLVQPPDQEHWYKFIDNKWVYYFPPQTKDGLSQYIYTLKSDIAYTGIYLNKDTDVYVFETDKESIAMCNSKMTILDSLTSNYILWKVYKDGLACTLRLSKDQFKKIYLFGMNMIDEAFFIEGQLNSQIQIMSEQQLANEQFINNFKQKAAQKFGTINKIYTMQTVTTE